MAVVAMTHLLMPLATMGSFIEPDLSNAMYMFEFTSVRTPVECSAPPLQRRER